MASVVVYGLATPTDAGLMSAADKAKLDGLSGGGGGAQNNFTATAPPAVTDDTTAGYTPSSVWYDTVGQIIYVCIDATAGAAQWLPYSGEVWALDADGEVVDHDALVGGSFLTSVIDRIGTVTVDKFDAFSFPTVGNRTKVIGADGNEIESFVHSWDFAGSSTAEALVEARDPTGLNTAGFTLGYSSFGGSIGLIITQGGVQTSRFVAVQGSGLSFESTESLTFNNTGSAEMVLTQFPNTRNDGATSTCLYTDASGNLRHGTIAGGGGGTVTDLSNTPSATDILIGNTGGNDTTLPAATGALAGVLTAADKTKLDGISTGATVSDLSNTPSASDVLIGNTGGTDTTLPAATGSLAGVMVAADKTKLDGIATGATVTDLSNTPSANDVLIGNTGGNDTTLPAATTSLAGVMTGADKTKLDAAITNNDLTINNQTTNYTLLSTDKDAIVVVNSAGSVDITVPTGLDIGSQILVRRRGTGAVNFVAGGGMTLESVGTTIANQYESAVVIIEAAGLASVLGSLA